MNNKTFRYVQSQKSGKQNNFKLFVIKKIK